MNSKFNMLASCFLSSIVFGLFLLFSKYSIWDLASFLGKKSLVEIIVGLLLLLFGSAFLTGLLQTFTNKDYENIFLAFIGAIISIGFFYYFSITENGIKENIFANLSFIIGLFILVTILINFVIDLLERTFLLLKFKVPDNKDRLTITIGLFATIISLIALFK